MKEYYNKFDVRVLENNQDFDQYYAFRYQVYCVKYPWMPQNPFEMEVDRYDKFIRSQESDSFAIGIFDRDNGAIVGGHRCLIWPEKFMFSGEYEGVFGDIELKVGPHVCEFSRWTIHGDFIRSLIGREEWKTGPTLHLLKMEFLELKKKGIKWIYTVSYPVLLKAFNKRGFPYKEIAISTLSNGDKVQLALMDLEEFESINQGTAMLDWFYDGFTELEIAA